MRQFLCGNFVGRDVIWGVDVVNYSGTGSTLVDSVGSNNLTLLSSPTYTATPPSLTFNSMTGGSTANTADIQVNTGTITVWAAPTSGNSGFRGVLTKENAYGIFCVNNKLCVYDWGAQTLRDSGVTVGNGSWQMLSLSFSGINGVPSNNAILYLNGIAVMTTTLRLVNQSTTGLWLGSNNGNQGFVGAISSAYVYADVITQAELLAHYNYTKSRFSL